MSVAIRPCRPDDAETLVALVRALAEYERLEAFARATPDDFRTHLFGTRPVAEAILAEIEGMAVGFAVYFSTFSTFRGEPGIYLEDIFVRPECRGKGIGKALLAYVARAAVARGCGRVEWSVLDWNERALGFYRALGAHALDEWTIYRIEGEPLLHLSRFAPAALPNAETCAG